MGQRGRILGVVHLIAMPGDPGHEESSDVVAAALGDAAALMAGGVDGLVIENFGSVPFATGGPGDRLPPHQVVIMAVVAAEVRRRFPAAWLGVNCLRNDAMAALGVAAGCGLDFVRVNVHTGAYVTDQGMIEGEAHRSLRYRRQLGCQDRVAILADVLVKHARPLAPLEPEEATRDCVERGLADGVIVTGQATGAPVSAELLRRVRAAAAGCPVFIGSGLTLDNAAALLPSADGAIVGTAFKEEGQVRRPVEQARVERLVEHVREVWGERP